MDLYEGSVCDLKKRYSNPGKYLKSLTHDILSALVYLASRNVIHRDVKPANILYDAKRTFYLSDFGLSKWQNKSFTPIGTAMFAAPEVFCKCDQTPKADVFSLGLVMLDLLGILPEGKMDDFFSDYKDWHEIVRSVASQYKPEILPMIVERSDRRYTASKCRVWFAKEQVQSVFKPVELDFFSPEHSFTDPLPWISKVPSHVGFRTKVEDEPNQGRTEKDGQPPLGTTKRELAKTAFEPARPGFSSSSIARADPFNSIKQARSQVKESTHSSPASRPQRPSVDTKFKSRSRSSTDTIGTPDSYRSTCRLDG